MLKRSILAVGLVTSFIIASAACSDDEASSDVPGSCDAMCKGAGFTASNVDQAAHETNCFCTGGSGTVTAAACTDMCKSTGKPGRVFNNGSGCQCQ